MTCTQATRCVSEIFEALQMRVSRWPVCLDPGLCKLDRTYCLQGVESMKATDGFPHVDKQSHARREVRTRSREMLVSMNARLSPIGFDCQLQVSVDGWLQNDPGCALSKATLTGNCEALVDDFADCTKIMVCTSR